jgi:hypothetical protein
LENLLDAWDWSRSGKHELYTLLYDIKQAYDSVQPHVLARAMRRLRMPLGFVELVVNSLTGLRSRVRTPFVRLRLLCLDGIQTFFHAHKEQQR